MLAGASPLIAQQLGVARILPPDPADDIRTRIQKSFRRQIVGNSIEEKLARAYAA